MGQLLPHLSVRNNLLYGYRNIVPEQRQFALHEVVKLLEIEHLLERKATALSGGEKTARCVRARGVVFTVVTLVG